MTQLLTYQTFINQTAAEDVADILKHNDIPFEFETTDNIGASFIGFNDGTKNIALKLAAEDFAKADNAIEQATIEQIPHLEEDYYLFSFSKKELLDIAKEPDNWSKFDYFLAKHLLLTKNDDVSNQQLETLQEERIKKLAEPETNSTSWVKIGYATFITVGLGLIIGLILLTHKKTLPNGESVFAYKYNDRKHGLLIIALSLVTLAVYSVLLYIRYTQMTDDIHVYRIFKL